MTPTTSPTRLAPGTRVRITTSEWYANQWPETAAKLAGATGTVVEDPEIDDPFTNVEERYAIEMDEPYLSEDVAREGGANFGLSMHFLYPAEPGAAIETI